MRGQYGSSRLLILHVGGQIEEVDEPAGDHEREAGEEVFVEREGFFWVHIA